MLARDREGDLVRQRRRLSSSASPDHVRADGANAVVSSSTWFEQGGCPRFSIGGMVAQEITLQAPDLVRKLILVGTGPRGGQGMASLTQ